MTRVTSFQKGNDSRNCVMISPIEIVGLRDSSHWLDSSHIKSTWLNFKIWWLVTTLYSIKIMQILNARNYKFIIHHFPYMCEEPNLDSYCYKMIQLEIKFAYWYVFVKGTSLGFLLAFVSNWAKIAVFSQSQSGCLIGVGSMAYRRAPCVVQGPSPWWVHF